MTTRPRKTAANRADQPENDGFEPARAAILAEALKIAPFEGWGRGTFDAAAREAQIDSPTAKAAFPRGVSDLLRFWAELHDATMSSKMTGAAFEDLKIREKVRFAVRARLDAMAPDKEAARRAAAYLALPPHGFLGAKLTWKTADAIWRGLGDKSTDFNYYTKRATLSGVWTSTLARWFADDSEDEAATNAFLDARIDNVMQIEKAKAQMRKTGLDPKAPIEFLARLRYPAGR